MLRVREGGEEQTADRRVSPRMRTSPFCVAGLAAGLFLLSGSAWGQADVQVGTPAGGGGPALVKMPSPDDPAQEQYRATQRERVKAEKEMRKLRVEFFDNIRSTEIRQIGIAKLRKYADKPYLYPSLLREFARSGEDVRGTILDMFVDQQTDEADTTLVWTAVFDKDPELRTMASERLQKRIAARGEATERIKQVIALGLKPGASEEEMKTASILADKLNVIEVIPLLISAQLGGQQTAVGGGGTQDGESALAIILVGTQTAFVSDLEPVVGDSAVAFDPTISVVTEGTVLRIIDAHVFTYRMDVHYALTRLSERAWGRPTDHFGFDQPRWARWYKEEFQPYLKAKQGEKAAGAERTR
jgi:hypothetical protein